MRISSAEGDAGRAVAQVAGPVIWWLVGGWTAGALPAWREMPVAWLRPCDHSAPAVNVI